VGVVVTGIVSAGFLLPFKVFLGAAFFFFFFTAMALFSLLLI
jgi:uncharacterized membrane protein YiaA